jgi:hypothetical protein
MAHHRRQSPVSRGPCNHQFTQHFSAMIDTIAFTISGHLRSEYDSIHDLPRAWKSKACGDLERDKEFQSVMLTCKPIDLTIFGSGRGFNSVRANLPKLIWGHNGRVITTEAELTLSFQWLEYLLGLILKPSFPNKAFVPGLPDTPDSHYTRIDLAWQFEPEKGVFYALSNAEHEKIRSLPSLIKGQTVHLRGSFLEILCYEKVRQMQLRSHLGNEVHRVEFRLKNRALNDVYLGPKGEGYTCIPFEWCKHLMRRIAAETEGHPLAVAKGTIAQFLAEIDAEAPGFRIVEKYKHFRRMRPESARKLEKQIRSCRHTTPGMRTFADYFPMGDWPPPIQIPLPQHEEWHQWWLAQHIEESNNSLADRMVASRTTTV